MKLECHFDILPCREKREQVVLLKDEADIAADQYQFGSTGQVQWM